MDPSFNPFSIDPPPPPIIPVLLAHALTSAAAPPPMADVVNPTTASVTHAPYTAADVANPTTASVTLPPYTDMIFEAIAALKDRNGSSKRAIGKYIESAYKDLPPTHSALLTHHLKKLKNNGQLVMVKKSYMLAYDARSEGMLPDSTANPYGAASSPTPKRGRGRPPKPKKELTTNPPQPMLAPIDPNLQPPMLAAIDPSTQQPIPFTDGSKRSPGRPRKNGLTGRGRGRPPKTGLKKSPGRPRKPKTVRSVVGMNAVKRGRGRPPKSVTQLPPPPPIFPIQGQPVAVPYADASTVVASKLPSPRPRGRPKGSVAAAGLASKRRGRPPKLGGIMARKTTGKPVGRPRKITGGAESKAVADSCADLKGKLEFFQSKVKQALRVLRPHYTGGSNISVIDAIQELEGLAGMDFNTAFTEAPPPLQPPAQLPALNEG